MDIVEESEEEVDSLGCCSCFGFNLFKGRHFRKCKVETADDRISASESSIISIFELNDEYILPCEEFEEEDLISEFKRPVDQVEIPKSPPKPKAPPKPKSPEKPKEPSKPKAPEKPKEPSKPKPPKKPKAPEKPKEPSKPKPEFKRPVKVVDIPKP
ncbi:Uncharacterized protein Fot_22617 [Forsythia ovata]|uniref:Uncharacterized protein n=1 Tax=Forsythia ovata TaxID=205694 RepID=A0ABD1UYK1_9LAMI